MDYKTQLKIALDALHLIKMNSYEPLISDIAHNAIMTIIDIARDVKNNDN